MLAEELHILADEDALWQAARPLLDVALRLEQAAETVVWHGWQKRQMETFLADLPSPCSLVVGVWDTLAATETEAARDVLVLGVVCKVEQGKICSLCTFTSLVAAGLKPVAELEIGMEDALDIIHYARRKYAPVAWALFLDRAAWDEWLFTAAEDGGALDKGALLEQLAEAGRCVLMGSQAAHQEG